MGNLVEGLHKEIVRCKELLEFYKEIPQGDFGAMIIEQKIQKAESALASGDPIEMVKSYNALVSCK